jgi:hypothetical protein
MLFRSIAGALLLLIKHRELDNCVTPIYTSMNNLRNEQGVNVGADLDQKSSYT